MYILSANYGNDSIALIQWASENSLEDVMVVSVDTGWPAPTWRTHVEKAEDYARQCGFTVKRITPKNTLPDLIRERNAFPSIKFQWCAGFIKGLPLLEWLDEIDDVCEAIIMLGRRQATSRATSDLTEIIEESEHFGERKLWHPLFAHTDEERDALLARAGFTALKHRSLECCLCVNSDWQDILEVESGSVDIVAALEEDVGQPMFNSKEFPAKDIKSLIKRVKSEFQNSSDSSTRGELFDMGCGSKYGCGE